VQRPVVRARLGGPRSKSKIAADIADYQPNLALSNDPGSPWAGCGATRFILAQRTVMVQLENIEAIEARLWRARISYAPGRSWRAMTSCPVMGLIFFGHAYSRFLNVEPCIEANLPTRRGVTRALTKEDFGQKRSDLTAAGGAVRLLHPTTEAI
jgi:hypothetical protein